MEIQNWEPHVSWGRRWGQEGAWGEEVGGQEGVRALGWEERARDGLRTASSVWFAGLARVCSYWWRAFLFWNRRGGGANLLFSGGRSRTLGSSRSLPRRFLFFSRFGSTDQIVDAVNIRERPYPVRVPVPDSSTHSQKRKEKRGNRFIKSSAWKHVAGLLWLSGDVVFINHLLCSYPKKTSVVFSSFELEYRLKYA